MPRTNRQMIKNLQMAINKKFDSRLLYNKTQFFSASQDRPVTLYIIRQAQWSEERGKYINVELFSSTSQIQIVLWLRDYWFELNDWEVPNDNPMWEEAKANYIRKVQGDAYKEKYLKTNRKGGKTNGNKKGNKTE